MTAESVNTLAEWLHRTTKIREGYFWPWSKLTGAQKARSIHLAKVLLSNPPEVLIEAIKEMSCKPATASNAAD